MSTSLSAKIELYVQLRANGFINASAYKYVTGKRWNYSAETKRDYQDTLIILNKVATSN